MLSRTHLAAIGLAIALILSACGSGSDSEAADQGPVLAGYEREPEPTVGEVTLPAVNRSGEDFAIKADPGEMLIVYFGFANCPDICPTTLADTRLALADLGPRADDVNVAFITVDPERDTDQITTDYVEAFIEGSIALRTEDPQELLIAADAFGVTYQIVENDDGDIEVAHTPNLYVVDDQGAIILTWPFGVPATDIASDLNILLDRV